jgi:hypothetical protein
MSTGAMTWRLLGASCVLALLLAVHGCGGDEDVETVARDDR